MNNQDLIQRYDQLKGERSNLENVLQLVERFVQPHRNDFLDDTVDELSAEWRRREVYDSTAIVDCERLGAKIATNLIPHTHRWFNLAFNDDDLEEDQGAREWLDDCQDRMWKELIESDFHAEGTIMCSDVSGVGTSLMFMDELREDMAYRGIDFTTGPLMDTYFDVDHNDQVLSFFVRKRWTHDQIKSRFPDAELDIDDKDATTKHEVVFCVFHRLEKKRADTTRFLAPKERPVGFKWIFSPTQETLAEGGYYHMSAYRFVWGRAAGSKYGYSPAILALADILQLNDHQAMKSEATAKSLDPPYWATERGIIGDLDLRAGGLTIVTDPDKFGEMYTPSNFPAGEREAERLTENIHRYFSHDLLDLKRSPEMTATEVHARLERIREHFGPTIGRHEKTLSLMLENLFVTLLRNNRLQAPPQYVQDAELDIEFTGKLSKIMRSGEAESAEQWVGGLVMLSEQYPQILDNLDPDEYAVGTAETRGVPAKYRRDKKEIEKMREERAQKQDLAEQIAATQGAGQAMQQAAEGQQAMQAVE